MCCLFFLCAEMSVSQLLLPPPPPSGSWMEEGQLTWQGRQTNKQTEEIKIEKNRAAETWCCVFITVRLMAYSSHYSLLCPLPPIGCNIAAWQGCQCRVISCFCLTTWTTRATSHHDGFFLFLAPQVAMFLKCGKGRSHLISPKTFFF